MGKFPSRFEGRKLQLEVAEKESLGILDGVVKSRIYYIMTGSRNAQHTHMYASAFAIPRLVYRIFLLAIFSGKMDFFTSPSFLGP